MDYLFVVCLTLLLFFFGLLLKRREKTLSDKILIAWQVIIILTELSFLLQQNGYLGKFVFFYEAICTSHVLHGTFLFFYYRSFSNSKFTLKYIHLLHLLPLLVLFFSKLTMNAIFYESSNGRYQDCYYGYYPYATWLYFFSALVIGSYIFLTYIWHLRQKRTELFLLSNNAHAQAWINILVHGIAVLFLLIVVIQLLPIVSFVRLNDDGIITNSIISVFILLFIYAGNKDTLIIVNPFSDKLVDNQVVVDQEKPMDERIREHFVVVEQCMQIKELYLDPELSLHSLAEQAGLSNAAVSQSIKASTGLSFPYYVNSFRIYSLLEKLRDPKFKNYTILALAFECGFNSKASFNRIFKLHIGKTPSEYISELPKNEN